MEKKPSVSNGDASALASTEVSRSDFPPDFVFGVATSAYQVILDAPLSCHFPFLLIFLGFLMREALDSDLIVVWVVPFFDSFLLGDLR